MPRFSDFVMQSRKLSQRQMSAMQPTPDFGARWPNHLPVSAIFHFP